MSPAGLGRPFRYLADVDRAWREARSTAPLPLLRWAAAVGVFIGQWAAGIPAHPSGWICPGVIAGLMILPDLSSITFGGMKLEMRRQEAEIERLGSQLQQIQNNQVVAANTGHQINLLSLLENPEKMAALLEPLRATSANVASEEARGGDVPSSALDRFTAHAEVGWSTGGVDL